MNLDGPPTPISLLFIPPFDQRPRTVTGATRSTAPTRNGSHAQSESASTKKDNITVDMDVATRTLHVLVPRQSQGSNRGSSNSASSVVSTLVPILLISTVVFIVFLYLQKRATRVYYPRSLETVVPQHDQTPALKGGVVGWLTNFKVLTDFKSVTDAHVLQHQSLDGFLYLRFLKMLSIISLIGCFITWPVLFPINATGGGGQQQLDIVSLSNVANPNRYYAHAIIAWIFMGFVVLVVTRERLYFIGLRQAYFLSSFHAQRLSSRTVLFLGIPKDLLNEGALRELLGPYVSKIWMVPNCDKLQDLVKDKDKLWTKFEKGQVSLIMDANKKRMKADDKTENEPFKFVDKKSRPTHRLKPIIGKKVDTIDYGRTELPKMGQQIEEQQNSAFDGRSNSVPAAFVEFTSQAAAQEAFQLAARDKRSTFTPRYIGVQPEEVIWKNLGVSLASRKIKMIIATTIIVLMVIFWAIPVAFVGILSNINYLTNKVPFLSFIDKIPHVILGVVTGLLPSVLLAVLMALVPVFCRFLAKFAGLPTLSAVELKTQSWYFIFQVVQVFLITTFTSGAASVASQIVQHPTTAVSLLATNLPKASNFYISYFIVLGLMQAALMLLNIVPYLMLTIVGKYLDKTPRKLYTRWMSLAGLGWGSVYPKFTNLGVIALSYSCIAPLVLGFSTIGFALLYIGFRYNFFFVFGIQVDMKGESYPKALQHLLTGVYLSTLCLIGLFGIGIANSTSSLGAVILMVVFLVALIIYQVLINIALGPLERNLPLDLLETNEDSIKVAMQVEEGKHAPNAESAAEREAENEKVAQHWQPTSNSDKKPRKPNFLTTKLTPYIHKYFEESRTLLGGSSALQEMPRYTAEGVGNAYLHPALTTDKPFVWLPQDQMGLSKTLLEENRNVGIDGSDRGAWLNDKGKIEWDQQHPQQAPIWEEKRVW